jgi:excisionase family DNA binding protein
MNEIAALLHQTLETLRDEIRIAVLADLRADVLPQWPEWLSISTAAVYLDMSEERVRKLQARGVLPYHQEGPGCRVFFKRTDLDATMEALRQ